MPLSTQVIRNGSPVPVKWSSFHVAAMVIASIVDSKNDKLLSRLNIDTTLPIIVSHGDVWALVSYPVLAQTPLNADGYTLTGRYVFFDESDGEEFTLETGDTLVAYRSL